MFGDKVRLVRGEEEWSKKREQYVGRWENVVEGINMALQVPGTQDMEGTGHVWRALLTTVGPSLPQTYTLFLNLPAQSHLESS